MDPGFLITFILIFLIVLSVSILNSMSTKMIKLELYHYLIVTLTFFYFIVYITLFFTFIHSTYIIYKDRYILQTTENPSYELIYEYNEKLNYVKRSIFKSIVPEDIKLYKLYPTEEE